MLRFRSPPSSPPCDAPPPCNPPPCNPPNLCTPDGNVQFSIADDDQPTTTWSHFHDDISDLWPEIKQDYRNYYCWENLGMLAAGFRRCGADGQLAKRSGTARTISRTRTRTLRQSISPPGAKNLAMAPSMIPVMAAGWIGGDIMYDWPAGSVIGEWGERSMRSLLVGAPPMLLMQWVTGGARPGEDDDGSGWRPFTHSNGVSGHAFIGGVMFIDAAKMTDNSMAQGRSSTPARSCPPGRASMTMPTSHRKPSWDGGWPTAPPPRSIRRSEISPIGEVVPLPLDDGVGMAIHVSVLDAEAQSCRRRECGQRRISIRSRTTSPSPCAIRSDGRTRTRRFCRSRTGRRCGSSIRGHTFATSSRIAP